jgi:hypothetical protein
LFIMSILPSWVMDRQKHSLNYTLDPCATLDVINAKSKATIHGFSVVIFNPVS